MEVLRATIYPMLVMGGLAIFFAIGLGIAAKVFYVYVDPKVGEGNCHDYVSWHCR